MKDKTHPGLVSGELIISDPLGSYLRVVHDWLVCWYRVDKRAVVLCERGGVKERKNGPLSKERLWERRVG